MYHYCWSCELWVIVSIYRDVLCQLDRQRLLKHLVQSLQGFHVLYNAGYIKDILKSQLQLFYMNFIHKLFSEGCMLLRFKYRATFYIWILILFILINQHNAVKRYIKSHIVLIYFQRHIHAFSTRFQHNFYINTTLYCSKCR